MAKSIGQIINELLERNGIAHKVKEYEIINSWPEIVGEAVSKVTQAREVRDGRLYVEVSNSVWRNELFYMKTQIIQELNKKAGKKIIHDILLV